MPGDQIQLVLPGEATVVAICGAVTATAEATKAVAEVIKVVYEKTPAAQLEAQSKVVIEALKPIQAGLEGLNRLLGLPIKKEG